MPVGRKRVSGASAVKNKEKGMNGERKREREARGVREKFLKSGEKKGCE